MRSVFALCVTLGFALVGSHVAQAQDGSGAPINAPPAAPFLSVTREDGAESCPDTEALTAHVNRVRGQEAEGKSGAYRVDFTYREGVFRAAIHSGAGTSTRVLRDHGATCAALAQATALTLALLLDADPLEPPETIEPPVVAAAPPVSKPQPPSEEEPAPRRLERSLTFALGGGALFGVERLAAPVVLADLGISIGRFRTSLGVMWMPTQTLEFGPGTLHETLLSGVARTCLSAWQNDLLRVDLCSGFYAGMLEVRAEGYTRNDDVQKAWLAIPLGLGLATTPTPVSVELGGSVLIPIRRNDFSIDNLGVVYESWPVGLLLSARAVGVWLL